MGFCNFFRIPEYLPIFFRINFICVILCADIDECLNIPCKNGATCNNKPGSYSCSCSAGWTGKDCDEGNCLVKVWTEMKRQWKKRQRFAFFCGVRIPTCTSFKQDGKKVQRDSYLSLRLVSNIKLYSNKPILMRNISIVIFLAYLYQSAHIKFDL